MQNSLIPRLFFTLVSISTLSAFAQSTEVFTAIASNKGQVVYTEKHTAEFDKDQKIRTATTEYLDPSGKLIAKLKSDFSQSLTAPAHDFEDLRFKHKHGIRYEGDKTIIYSQDEDEPEKTKIIARVKDQNGLVVGCQGLAYYFRDNLDSVKRQKNIPIQFLIPGKLESYDFELKYLKTDESKISSMDIEIKSWFLKMFAPKLEIKYNENTRRFLYYKGLSNLYDDKKNQQSVEIVYTYPEKIIAP